MTQIVVKMRENSLRWLGHIKRGKTVRLIKGICVKNKEEKEDKKEVWRRNRE